MSNLDLFRNSFSLIRFDGAPLSYSVNKFPDGQIQFVCDPTTVKVGGPLTVNCSLFTSADIDLLYQISTWAAQHDINWNLNIKYLYGARSDKYESHGANVSRMMATMFSGFSYSRLRIWCPHSGFVDKAVVPIPKFIQTLQIGTIVYPDHSAYERFGAIMAKVYPTAATVICGKERDQVSGNIIRHEIPGLIDGIRDVLVIDDLCDGGATFVNVGRELGIHRNRLILYTVHGLYTNNGTAELAEYYGRIFCSTSCAKFWFGKDYPHLNVVPDTEMCWFRYNRSTSAPYDTAEVFY